MVTLFIHTQCLCNQFYIFIVLKRIHVYIIATKYMLFIYTNTMCDLYEIQKSLIYKIVLIFPMVFSNWLLHEQIQDFQFVLCMLIEMNRKPILMEYAETSPTCQGYMELLS